MKTMIHKRIPQRALARGAYLLCAFLLTGGVAIAQLGGPASDVGGNASRELSRIYTQGVGNGYSGTSLNQISLRSAQARVPNVGQSAAPSARIGLGAGGSGSAARKPFSGYSSAPTVSPYLNLFREDFDGSSDFNYNTLVRPMLQQQQFNEQVQRQSMEVATRLQTIAAQADFNPQGSTTQAPTGHQTVFNYHSHYYPAQRPKR
jgi:hypothetical protein